MFCPQCAIQMADSATFCRKCGAVAEAAAFFGLKRSAY